MMDLGSDPVHGSSDARSLHIALTRMEQTRATAPRRAVAKCGIAPGQSSTCASYSVCPQLLVTYAQCQPMPLLPAAQPLQQPLPWS